jgi:hypothetical protein
MGHMGDGQDATEVGRDRVDGPHQAIATLVVLGAEAFIHNQKL